MIEPSVVLWTLTEASLRATAVAVLVGSALVVLRVRSSGAQHAAWTAVMAAMLAMPMLSAIAPVIETPMVRWPVASVAMVSSANLQNPANPANPANPVNPVNLVNPVIPVNPVHLVNPANLAVVLYAAIALFLFARGVVGWFAAKRLVRLAGSAGLDRSSRILESAHVSGPVTVGAFAPRIVLPLAWRQWPVDHLRAVLAHEGAHVARRDPLVALVAGMNRCVFWFHPLAWALERRLAAAAEDACDEAAIGAVGEPRRYAEILVHTAAAVSRQGRRAVWQGTPMAGSARLDRRIGRVLAGAHPSVPRWRKAALAACCGVALAVSVACRPESAQPAGPRTDWRPTLDTRSNQLAWFLESFPDTEVAVDQVDRPEAERILRQHLAEEPDGPWAARLGRLYASALIGHWVRLSERGPLQEITNFDPDSAFAALARDTLEQSNDAKMLVAAATYLLETRGYSGSFGEADLIARGYLERAVRLQPELTNARTALVSVASRERRNAAWRNPLAPPAFHYDAVSALPDRQRFAALPEIVMAAYESMLGASRWTDPNMREYIQLKRDLAVRGSRDLLLLASRMPDHPERGAAIFKANLTLGALAAGDGDLSGAVRHLQAAAAAPPSEELVYGKDLMWRHQRFIAQLLRAGEREAVAGFFDALASVNVAEPARLTETAAAIRRGDTPPL